MASKSGKGSRSRRKSARKNAKAARKLAYAALAGQPNSRKKSGKGYGSQREPGHAHRGPCGNAACTICTSGAHNDPWQAERGSCLYGKRYSSPKHRSRKP